MFPPADCFPNSVTENESEGQLPNVDTLLIPDYSEALRENCIENIIGADKNNIFNVQVDKEPINIWNSQEMQDGRTPLNISNLQVQLDI